MGNSSMRRWESVSIVGVGLIGASIGLALRERKLAKKVIGIGRRSSSLQKAKRRGAISSTTTNLARGVRDSQLIVICTPVEMIASQVIEVARHSCPNAIITDAGSTKNEIVRTVEEALRASTEEAGFVGSHPMAGSEKTGPTHAQADLFVNRSTIITPTENTSNEAIKQVEQFWKQLGSRVVRMSPQEHDRSVAAISHLPHVVASALAVATSERDLLLASTGWFDTTRIASGDPELWRQILSENRGSVLKSIDQFEKALSSLRRAIERGDQKQILQLLEEGKQRRASSM